MNYLKNLLRAILGKNPYLLDMETVSRAYEQAAERVQSLEKVYAQVQQKMSEDDQQLKGYQKLTENLRQRLAEKDAQMKEQATVYSEAVNTLRKQHKMQRGEWATKNEELRDDLNATLEQLQRVNQDIGREMMSANMLAKTNAALNDLCTAMEAGDMEMMKQAVEYLDWSNLLVRIAQRHLIVLRIKTELEERRMPD